MINPFKKFQEEEKNSTKNREIVWMADMHIPYVKLDMVEKILHEHKGSFMCVLGGDIMDAYGISYFRKSAYVSLLQEYVVACEIIDKAAETFEWVYLLQGNHEARWERQILSKQPIEVAGMSKSLLKRIADGERYDLDSESWYSIGTMKNVLCPVKKSGEVDWYCQVGKTIFCHPEKFSKIYGRTVQFAEEFFYKQGFDFDSIVMGHTHKLVQIYSPTCLMIEAGCLREKAEYGMSTKLSYTPQTNGYAVINQDMNGNTNFHKSRAVYLGS